MLLRRTFSSKAVANYYDIVINGGGMIGSTLACKLAKNPVLKNLSILLIESGPLINWNSILSKQPGSFSNRVSSLNENSKNLLQKIGIWETINSTSCRNVTQMKVWGNGSKDICTTFKAEDEHVSQSLAYIVENNIIIAAAIKELEALDDRIEILHSHITEYNLPITQDENVNICLNDGTKIECGLLLGSDGVNSKVRQAMGVQYISWKYNQRAVVATLKINENGKNQTAWQKFLSNGPVALLPLADNLSSLVWTTTPEHAEVLLSLTNESFTDALNTVLWDEHISDVLTSNVTSSISQIFNLLNVPEEKHSINPPTITDVIENSRSSFPVGFGHASNYIKPRVALLGDAAHRVHPLAGQGVNLGFSDVHCFDNILTKYLSFGTKFVSTTCLKEYESVQQKYNTPKLIAIDLIQKVAGHRWSPLLAATNAAIQISDAVPQIKKCLISSAAV